MIFSLYRPYVDEIVCAVDSRFSNEELSALSGVADRIIRFEMGPGFLQEHYRAWLYAQCTGDWIISTDSDEVPSERFLGSLRRLAASKDVVTYLTTIRWLYPDLEHWLDEYPWEPSWKLIMAKNDPASLYIKGGVHEGVYPTEPYRLLDLPLYHLDTAINSVEARKNKVAFYDTLAGTQLTEAGTPVNTNYYLPELFARYPQAAVPDEDLEAIRLVAEAADPQDRVLDRVLNDDTPLPPGTVTRAEAERYRLEHAFSESAYRARIEIMGRSRSPRRGVEDLVAGEHRQIMVRVRNDGDETWLRAGRNDIGVASKWFRREAPTLESVDLSQPPYQEGPRTQFTANVHPGEEHLLPVNLEVPDEPGSYLLAVDLVREHVRWFNCAQQVPVEVRPR